MNWYSLYYYLKSMLFLFFLTLAFVLHAQTKLSGAYYCAQHKSAKNYCKLDNSNTSIKHAFDVIHYDLDIDLYACYTMPFPKNFNATCKITLLIDSLLNHIELDADNYSLIINNISSPVNSFTHYNNKLRIMFAQTYNPGDTIEIVIQYQRKNVVDDAFYVSGGFVFTDCEPQGARKWFPCYDRPSDKATLRLEAKTPVGVLLGSNGKMISNSLINDTIHFIWLSRDPIATYLMVITSKMNYNLEIIHWKNPLNQNDSFPIWFYYNSGEDISYSKDLILQVTNCFTEKFGPHPFEKNGFATLNSDFTWGGMENQSLSSLCPGCWIEVVLVHEYAHQWFGDMITCATWSDLWLNEGFATYCEALWEEYKLNYTAYHNVILAKADYYLNHNPGWPVYNASWAIYPPQNDTLFNGAITYYKGCCVLHMLRYMLGDSLFFNLIYDYANDTNNFRYKSATTRNFMDKVNDVTDDNYNWFFEQWIFQPNHPVYANTYAFNQTESNAWTVVFNAKQIQTNAPFFKMPVEIKISFQDNSDTLIRIMNDSNNQLFAFIFSKQPQNLIFDPNSNIVLKEGSTLQLPKLNKKSASGLNITLLPNPITDRHVVIQLNSVSTLNCSIKIVDNQGKIAANIFNGTINKGNTEIPFMLTNIKSGNYYILFESGYDIRAIPVTVVK